MKKKILLFGTILVVFQAFSQNVGINSTGANPANSAMLDIVATDKGMLVPRVALTATNAAGPITAPETSLLVYNTATASSGATQVIPGFYYWDGSQWLRFDSGNNIEDWKLEGNAGTTASASAIGTAANNNFLGTTDANDLVFATNGQEKFRIKSDGNTRARIGIGTAFTSNLNPSSTPSLIHLHDWGTTANDYPIMQLSTANTSSGRTVGILNFASTQTLNEKRVATIESYLTAASGTNASGDMRFFTNSSNTLEEKFRLGPDEAVFNEQSINYDLRVESNNDTEIFFVDASTDRIGFSVAAPSYPIHAELDHISYGARFDNTNASGVAVYGRNTAADGSGGGDGVLGRTSQTAGFGLYGLNANTSGTGAYIRGQNAGGSYLLAGSGAAISGTSTGAWLRATGTNSVGAIGSGDGEGAFSLIGESQGGAFTGADIGVYGFANSTSNDDGGGYFANDGSAYAYVGYRTGNTNYKILGSGTVSTIVTDLNDEKVTMFAPEAPEVLFTDYGIGKLKNGKAKIKLDPILAKNIFVDEDHPLRVFVQLKGDCNGVYVTNESIESFEVIELNEGQSNVEFNYTVVGNRKDEYHQEDGGKTSYQDLRFPSAPDKLKTQELKSGSREDDE